MKSPVDLKELIGEVDIQLDDIFTYVKVSTGELITLTLEEIRAAENELPLENYPEWQRENIELAICILEDEHGEYVEFALQEDFNEYEVMEEFIETLKDGKNKEELSAAIIGKGAFSRFKNKIVKFGIDKQWYSYKENKMKEMVIEWCAEHDIEFKN